MEERGQLWSYVGAHDAVAVNMLGLWSFPVLQHSYCIMYPPKTTYCPFADISFEPTSVSVSKFCVFC